MDYGDSANMYSRMDSPGARPFDRPGQQAAPAGAANASHCRQQQQQQQQRQRQHQQQQPMPAWGPAGVFHNGGGDHPIGSLGQMLNLVTAAISATGGSSASSVNSSIVALPGSVATHAQNIATLRTSMWVYLTPLLGLLYILSPLDIIPDFIPLLGWIDDALVLYYIVCSLFQLMKDRDVPSRS